MQEKRIRNLIKHYGHPSQKALKDTNQPQGTSNAVAWIHNFMKARKAKKNKWAGLLETHYPELFCGNLFRPILFCYLQTN